MSLHFHSCAPSRSRRVDRIDASTFRRVRDKKTKNPLAKEVHRKKKRKEKKEEEVENEGMSHLSHLHRIGERCKKRERKRDF